MRAAFVLLIGLFFLIPAGLYADQSDCFASFSSAYSALKTALHDRLGDNWKIDDLQPDIAKELTDLPDVSASLTSRDQDLSSRAQANQNDRSDLDQRKQANANALSATGGQRSQIQSSIQSIEASMQKLEDDQIKPHNAEYPSGTCMAPAEDPHACDGWVSAGQQLNAQMDAYETQRQSLQDQDDDLAQKEQQLQADAASLASEDNVLQQREQSLRDDTAAFDSDCTSAENRIAALTEVIKNPKQQLGRAATPPPQSPNDEARSAQKLFSSLFSDAGTAIVDGLIRKLPSAEAELTEGGSEAGAMSGVAITALDVIDQDMDEQADEVAKNTYLLGAYGAALTQLKQEGRLQPTDTGYQALLAASNALGDESPTSAGEFTWQSLGTRNYLRNTLEGYASDIVDAAGLTDGAGAAIVSRATPMDREVIGKTGVKVFEKSIDTVVGWAANKIGVDTPIELSSQYIEQRRRQAAQRSLQQ